MDYLIAVCHRQHNINSNIDDVTADKVISVKVIAGDIFEYVASKINLCDLPDANSQCLENVLKKQISNCGGNKKNFMTLLTLFRDLVNSQYIYRLQNIDYITLAFLFKL